MNQAVKIIVVGGNAAGPAAAAKAKRVNPSAQITLFEAGNYISTGTCEIPYVLSGEIKSYEDIIFNTAETFLNKKGVHVFTNHLVEEINRKSKTISVYNKLSGNRIIYPYDSLILSTGSVPKSIPGFTNDLENVFYLKSVQDLIAIRKYLDLNKVATATIIGSGYIGLEAADALIKIGLKINIVEAKTLPMPDAEAEISLKILHELKENSIQLIAGNENIEPYIIGNKVISLQCNNNSVQTDMVILAAGISPNNFLASNAKLEKGISGGIHVDRKLRTSDRNIFAAGDNIEVTNAITAKKEYLPFATYAHSYGHIAGENAAGGNAIAYPVIKNVTVKVLNNFVASVGLKSDSKQDIRFKPAYVTAEVPNIVSVMPGSKNVFGKLIFDAESKKILGASFYGGPEISGYADLISAAIHSSQKIDFLSKINYNYTPPLSPLINLLSVLGRKALKHL